ncbi:unnamed protein product [Clonostachys rosea f. rosea IK726]|uniref:Uncharacterized protein n=2 Tax=Bionectria ochroleuca TaxID=29856 RepID=A0A0B7K4H5_BIOOC|nr:unnamed protein product [Clonostachys rosea f. rosea IK726]
MTTILPPFSPRHIPPLFIATAFTLGGLLPLWNPARAIREYGLPERVAESPTAHSPFAAYGSRTTIIGVVMWTLYIRREYRSLDTVMSLLLFAGGVDGYLCWKEGVPGRGWFRFLSSVVFSVWGLAGLTGGME